MGDFERKHTTNPALIGLALNSIGVRGNMSKRHRGWPVFELTRVQQEGPWTRPGVTTLPSVPKLDRACRHRARVHVVLAALAKERDHANGLVAVRLLLLTGFRRLEALGL